MASRDNPDPSIRPFLRVHLTPPSLDEWLADNSELEPHERKTLAARDPQNTQWQRDLFVSHYKLAIVAERAGDAAEARAQYRKSHDILQAIADKGKHVSPEDMESLEWLKEKAGID